MSRPSRTALRTRCTRPVLLLATVFALIATPGSMASGQGIPPGEWRGCPPYFYCSFGSLCTGQLLYGACVGIPVQIPGVSCKLCECTYLVNYERGDWGYWRLTHWDCSGPIEIY